MTTTTATLADFLLVRLAEDEAAARAADSPDRWSTGWTRSHQASVEGDGWTVLSTASRGDATHIARHDPARVLAEVEAKRRIVRRARATAGVLDWDATWAFNETLRDLAAVYAGHEEFRAEWRL